MPCARAIFRDAIGDAPVRQEPGGDDQSGGTAVPQRSAASASDGLRAGGERGGRRPPRGQRSSSRATVRRPGVGLRVATSRPRSTSTPTSGSSRDTPACSSRCRSTWHEPVVLAEDVGLARIRHRIRRSSRGCRRGRGRRRRAAAARPPRPAADVGEHIAQVRRVLLAERDPHVESRAAAAGCARRRPCAIAAERGSALPCAVRTRRDRSAFTRRAARIPSWPVRPSGRCAGRRPRPAWRCTVRSRSTDSPRRQAD